MAWSIGSKKNQGHAASSIGSMHNFQVFDCHWAILCIQTKWRFPVRSVAFASGVVPYTRIFSESVFLAMVVNNASVIINKDLRASMGENEYFALAVLFTYRSVLVLFFCLFMYCFVLVWFSWFKVKMGEITTAEQI